MRREERFIIHLGSELELSEQSYSVRLITTAGHDILGNFEHCFTFRTAAESSDDKRGCKVDLQILQYSARLNRVLTEI